MEFDIVSISSSWAFRVVLGSNDYLVDLWGNGARANSHIKLTYDGSDITLYVNDGNPISIDSVTLGPHTIGFFIGNNSGYSSKFKNFLLYNV